MFLAPQTNFTKIFKKRFYCTAPTKSTQVSKIVFRLLDALFQRKILPKTLISRRTKKYVYFTRFLKNLEFNYLINSALK